METQGFNKQDLNFEGFKVTRHSADIFKKEEPKPEEVKKTQPKPKRYRPELGRPYYASFEEADRLLKDKP